MITMNILNAYEIPEGQRRNTSSIKKNGKDHNRRCQVYMNGKVKVITGCKAENCMLLDYGNRNGKRIICSIYSINKKAQTFNFNDCMTLLFT